MNQDELIERLKEVAEYDGWHDSTYSSFTPPNERYCFRSPDKKSYIKEPIMSDDFSYHTSFDWSVPVWSKAVDKVRELVFKNNPIDLHSFSLLCTQSINANDPLQFFINLSDLIREIKKHK